MQRFWSVLFGGVLLAEFVFILASAFIPGWWLPELANKDNYGADIDLLFYAILGATGFFFVLVSSILVYAMWRFVDGYTSKATYTHGNHRLEVLWTAVPAVILLLIAFGQIPAWERVKYREDFPKEPDQVMEVSARQFEWRIRYAEESRLAEMRTDQADMNQWGHNTLADYNDVRVVNEVHSWKGANTLIYLKTRDVLHSFFLPNLRLKQDAVPGKTIPVWFRADEWNTEAVEVKEDVLGPDGQPVMEKGSPVQRTVVRLDVREGKEWELACAELCGWGHYKMNGRLYIHKDKESYLRWLKYAGERQRERVREAPVGGK